MVQGLTPYRGEDGPCDMILVWFCKSKKTSTRLQIIAPVFFANRTFSRQFIADDPSNAINPKNGSVYRIKERKPHLIEI